MAVEMENPRVQYGGNKNVRPSVRKLYEGFRLLLGCKWLYAHGEPTTFSWRLAAACEAHDNAEKG